MGNRILLIIVLVSIVLKLAVWGYLLAYEPEPFVAADTRSYLDPAKTLVSTGNYSMSPQLANEPEIYRTPGYPAFLAAVIFFAGEQSGIVILVQILLSTALLIFVFFICQELWSNRVPSTIAVSLLAIDIVTFSYSLLLLSETLFTFLLTAMLFVLVRFLRTHRISLLVVAAVLLAAGTLVRPISYYLFVLYLVGFLLYARRIGWGWKLRLAGATALFVPFVLLVGSWQVRNYIRTGSSQFSSIEGFNLLFYRGAHIVSLRDGISMQEARQRLGFREWNWEAYRSDDTESLAISVARLSKKWKTQGAKLIIEHPQVFARSVISGVAHTLFTPGEGQLMRMLNVPIGKTRSVSDLSRLHYPATFIAFVYALIYLIVIYAGILSWFWRTPWSEKMQAPHLLLWGTLLYFLLISAGPEAFSRFRTPIMPILVIYASAGLMLIRTVAWSKVRRDRLDSDK